MITFVNFDIKYAVNIAPPKGHFYKLQQIFSYLKQHPQGMILIDFSNLFCITQVTFQRDCNLSEYFPYGEEDISLNHLPL